MKDDVHSELATLVFKKLEQTEEFHGMILRLQQEINIYGDTISVLNR